jgi:sigma-B regulation protein RsbU (phosphoserine phosphatase)
MASNAGKRGLYWALTLVFVLAMAYQAGFSVSATERRRHYDRIERPFEMSIDSDRFASVDAGMAAAGIQKGDQLIEVEGQRYIGGAQLARIFAGKHAGEPLAIKVRRKGSSEVESFSVPLRMWGAGPMPALGWVVFFGLTVFTPVLCLLLGFFVAAMRPRDMLAWLLLMLMLSFAQMSTTGISGLTALLQWPDGLRPLGLFYHTFFGGTWSIWILLFGIYFPERAGLDRRLPWLKWLFIAPIGVAALGDAFAVAGDAENYRRFAALPRLVNPLDKAAFFLEMIAISSFFANIWTKISFASSADARRRLILLVNGTSLALTPLFILVLYGLFHHGVDDVPEAVWIPCILMLAVFPITLAYVIVVQRALDVRVVIRQGLRYALARRGILAIQFIAVGVVTLSAATLVADPARNRPRKLQVIASGMIAALGIRRGGDKLQAWTDRRFFREAYNAEQILSELSDQVRTMVETKPLLETVAMRISSSLHVPRIAMLVKNDGHYGAAHAIGFDAPPEIQFAESAGTVAQLKRQRQPLRVYFDDPDSWIYREPGVTDSERARLRELEAQLLLPLAFKDKLVGFISLSAKLSEEPYSNSDVQLLGSVATQTGLALENSHLTEAIAVEVAHRERLNRELEIAREVQQRLFPQSYPAVAGLDLAGRCRPALGVGGDYYDFLELADGCLGIAIGDVSGKGIPAALLMASLQAALRGQTISGAPDLAKLMSNLNRLIYEATPSNRYATFFYGQYDPGTRRFTFVNAGHNAPMVFRNGEVLRLEDGGPVVGLFKPARYSQACAQLTEGDAIVLFTDGISEAMNAADEEWGEERLMEAVRACRQQPATEMIDSLMRDADAFVAGAPQHDDMTIMVVKLVQTDSATTGLPARH